MPKIIVDADPRFERQLKGLLSRLGIRERYETLVAVKAAVRQYRPWMAIGKPGSMAS